MPTSHFSQLNEIVQLIVYTDPQSILDIGPGFGKYGFLAREFLELWDGREELSKWTRRIEGIEAFPDYLTPVHEFAYDRVHIGDAAEIVAGLEDSYDLILMIDVLEHFDYERGLELVSRCLRIGRNLIISTPKNIGRQEAAFGNPYEVHRFQWRPRHLRSLGPCVFLPHDYSTICYLGPDTGMIAATMRYLRLRRLIRRWAPPLKFIYRRMRRSGRISPNADW